MNKIPTLFVRDRKTKLVTPEVTDGCSWVMAGDGIPSRKWDGTCCMIRGGRLFKRYDCRAVRGDDGVIVTDRPLPPDFEACEDDPDSFSGHWPGWVPVGDGPEDRWFREALIAVRDEGDNVVYLEPLEADDGTYELCGPKVQGNPEKCDRHVLIRHGKDALDIPDLSFDGLRRFLDGRDIEGIVWRGPDGKMAKLKGKDHGFDRPGQRRRS